MTAGLIEISPGLWRWQAAHPDWKEGAAPESAGDWPREVGCVLCDAPDATVFVDPLLPADSAPFLKRIDAHVARRERPVVVLTTIGFHRRDRATFVERYNASSSRAKRNLPAGVESFPVRGAGETIYWLSEQHALVPGDRIIGAGSGRLRVCPQSWLSYLPGRMTVESLRQSLRPLLELPVERVLVSHGEPVLSDAHRALAEALT